MNGFDFENNKTVTVDYTPFAETFARSRKGKNWSEFEDIYKILENYENFSVLDVGCGAGRFFGFLKEKYSDRVQYVGIDSSEGLIREAKKAFPEGEFSLCDMRNVEEVVGGQFDVIIFLASFHHLSTEQERREVLRASKKLLSEKGKIIMTNWNLKSAENQKKYTPETLGGSEFFVKIGDHQRYYHAFSLAEIETLAACAELSVQKNYFSEKERNIVSVFGG